MKIVIPGGSGQVGTVLARAFVADGHDVAVLSRSAKSQDWRFAEWDGKTLGDWADEIDGADIVINLAGRSVNCRYNDENRRQMMDSRVDSTRVVGEAIAKASNPPKVWLQASTATIYAHSFDKANDDVTGTIGGGEPDAPDTWRFSIEVAKAWEKAVDEAVTPKTRKVLMRSAMTMGPDREGIFDVMLGLVRKGLGGTAGSGRQYISWIHEQDFIRSVYWLIEHEELSGAINISSPNPLPNREFMRVFRETWGTRIGLPAMEWQLAIGAMLMRTETELILKSRRVVPKLLTDSGFEFEFA
ncbi:MAG: TIGR01777 family oxidoreductase, partial [Pyrinomonadaceae bacterium]